MSRSTDIVGNQKYYNNIFIIFNCRSLERKQVLNCMSSIYDGCSLNYEEFMKLSTLFSSVPVFVNSSSFLELLCSLLLDLQHFVLSTVIIQCFGRCWTIYPLKKICLSEGQ